jgi:hypothetical protein
MKKRTIYLPEWLDRVIEEEAKVDLRSFSSQVLFHLVRAHYRGPYFTDGGVSLRPGPTSFPGWPLEPQIETIAPSQPGDDEEVWW